MFERSATRPAHAPRMRIGPNWAAVSSPIATPLSVRCSTSSTRAIDVSQCADLGDQLSREEQPEVPHAERGEGGAQRASWSSDHGSSSHSTTRSTMSAARERVSTSAGSSLSSRMVSQAVRRARRASIRRRPAAVIATQTTRPSESSARRSTRPAAASFSTARGDARLRQPFAPGDVARGQRRPRARPRRGSKRSWGTGRRHRAGAGFA